MLLIEDFQKQFPLLKKHSNLQDNQLFHIYRHELCHFIEREDDKALLYNFGFKENFGQIPSLSDDKYVDSFLKRECRVIALEKVAPFKTEDTKYIYFGKYLLDYMKNINKKQLYDDYLYHMKSIITLEIWQIEFKRKYELLTSSLKMEV